MGLIKDDLGIEVDEEVLKVANDPKFKMTDDLLSYREQRKAKQQEIENEKKKKAEEGNKKPFGFPF